MVVVTGASGHIGNVLVCKLLKKGEKVKAIVSSKKNAKSLADLDCEIIEGDIRDLDFLNKTFEGADYVYHLAAVISIGIGDDKILYDINVLGTRNVVEACLKNNVKRLIYTSSVHALLEPENNGLVTERIQTDLTKVVGDYARTKVQATLEVLEGMKKGLNAVIVFPTGVIGPYDFKGSEMGRLVKEYMNGKEKFYIDGAYNFVDVRDVASGMILACQKGRAGESYLLGGEKITVQELFKILQKYTDIKPPKTWIPSWIAHIAGAFVSLWGALFHKKPLFTLYAVNVLESNSNISSEKAEKELGYSHRPIEETLKDTVEWFKNHNL